MCENQWIKTHGKTKFGSKKFIILHTDTFIISLTH